MKKFLVTLILAAFILRLLVIFIGYHGDLNNNISWGRLAFERGLINFYEAKEWPYSAPNQPPLTILTFWFLSGVWNLINTLSWFLNDKITIFPSGFIWFWEERGMIFLIKLPFIIADFGIAWIIYKTLLSRGKFIAVGLSLLWLYNPVSWYNSSVWGQTDSMVNFLGLLAIYYLLSKKIVRFSLFFTLSILFKGSLLIFVPILIFFIFKMRYKVGDLFNSLGVCLLTVIFITFWFHPFWDLFSWIIRLYQERILPGEIDYLTVNAFNFWWLLDSGKVADSTPFLGIQARIIGYLITVFFIFIVLVINYKKITKIKILFSLAVTAFTSFLFMTRIHERYLYPFFPLATILLGFVPSLVLPYTVLSFSHLINLYNLFWVPKFEFLEILLKTSWFAKLIVFVNILLFVITFFVYLKTVREDKKPYT